MCKTAMIIIGVLIKLISLFPYPNGFYNIIRKISWLNFPISWSVYDLVGCLFRVMSTVICNCLLFDILSFAFRLLGISFPLGMLGWVGLRGDCSHCLTSDKLFKFALFHELYLNVVTSIRQWRAESCRHFCRIYNPARITYVHNIWLSYR